MTSAESFFDTLKSMRKSQEIEISEICEFTRINPRYIEAIEKGDFNVLPNVYIRLFLKSYANFIGADSAKALKDYELYTTGKTTKSENPTSKEAGDTLPSLPPIEADMDSKPQISPKQIVSGVGVIFAILLLLWWAGRVTQEQTKNIIPNEPPSEVASESVSNAAKETSKQGSNLPAPDSQSISDQEMDTESEKQSIALSDKFPLNDNDFLPKMKDSEITQKVKLYPPYTISIRTLQETKLNISTIENTRIIELINQTVLGGEEFNFDFTSTVNFEFWRNNQVSVKLNKISIDNYLNNGNMKIRGSFEAEKSQLYVSFYKH